MHYLHNASLTDIIDIIPSGPMTHPSCAPSCRPVTASLIMHDPQWPCPISCWPTSCTSDHNSSYSIAWVRQPLQHSLRHWRSCHLRLRQPSSHQVLTGHQRTNTMTSSSLWSLWIVGLPYRESQERQESWRTQCTSIISWISLVIKVDGDTTIGSLLVQMQKHRGGVLVHS